MTSAKTHAASPAPADSNAILHSRSLGFAGPLGPTLTDPILVSVGTGNLTFVGFISKCNFPRKNTGAPRESQTNIKVIELMLLAVAFASQKAPVSHRVHRGRETMGSGESMIDPSNLRLSHPYTDFGGYGSALTPPPAIFTSVQGKWAQPGLRLGSFRKQ